MIAVVDTLLVNTKLSGVEKVLVVCPVNTLLNWKDEYEKWISWSERDYHVSKTKVQYTFSCRCLYSLFSLSLVLSVAQVFVLDDGPTKRHRKLMRWFCQGGVMLIGYDMYRNLAIGKRIRNKSVREDFAMCLLDPGAHKLLYCSFISLLSLSLSSGPDIIVCDEGHVLKRASTNLSQVLAGVRTKRRIVLTGTPLQNNLLECEITATYLVFYLSFSITDYCMVSFVKAESVGYHERIPQQLCQSYLQWSASRLTALGRTDDETESSHSPQITLWMY